MLKRLFSGVASSRVMTRITIATPVDMNGVPHLAHYRRISHSQTLPVVASSALPMSCES